MQSLFAAVAPLTGLALPAVPSRRRELSVAKREDLGRQLGAAVEAAGDDAAALAVIEAAYQDALCGPRVRHEARSIITREALPRIDLKAWQTIIATGERVIAQQRDLPRRTDGSRLATNNHLALWRHLCLRARSFARRGGALYESQQAIAYAVGLCRQTVNRLLADLEAWGLLRVVRRAKWVATPIGRRLVQDTSGYCPVSPSRGLAAAINRTAGQITQTIRRWHAERPWRRNWRVAEVAAPSVSQAATGSSRNVGRGSDRGWEDGPGFLETAGRGR